MSKTIVVHLSLLAISVLAIFGTIIYALVSGRKFNLGKYLEKHNYERYRELTTAFGAGPGMYNGFRHIRYIFDNRDCDDPLILREKLSARRHLKVLAVLVVALAINVIGIVISYGDSQRPKAIVDRDAGIEQSAELVASALSEQKFDWLTQALHYPSHLSPEERASEESGVLSALQLISEDLGDITSYEVADGLGTTYEIGIMAGDESYWVTKRNEPTTAVVYRTIFDKFGSGKLLFRFADAPTARERELWTIVFHLDARVPGARSRVIELSMKLVRQHADATGEQIPDHLREQFEASIPELTPGDD